MKHYVFFSVAGLILAVAALTASAAQSGKRADRAKILRGKYLVEKAGQCQDCHTPRNERGEYIGEYIKERWLMGSQISFKPTIPMPVWANESTNIAGLPGWENEDAITFLTGMAYDPRPLCRNIVSHGRMRKR